MTQIYSVSQLFVSKNMFLPLKTLNQHFDANLKKHLFAKFCSKFHAFSYFFSFLAQKNIKRAYFDQGLECAAPKCWSTYTLNAHELINAGKFWLNFDMNI